METNRTTEQTKHYSIHSTCVCEYPTVWLLFERGVYSKKYSMIMHAWYRENCATLPCPIVSISLILLLGIRILPVSSLICVDITGVSLRFLNWESGSTLGARVRYG